jgi:DNA-binding MarR family transcriptional regulator
LFLPLRLRQFDAILSRRLNQYLRGTTGLDRTELLILVTAREEQHSQKELAQLLSLHENVMTQVVRRLEQKLLITRTPDPRDRRRLVLLPTARAKRVVKKVLSVSAKVLHELLYPLSDEQIQQLDLIMKRLITETRWKELHSLEEDGSFEEHVQMPQAQMARDREA